jgi:hypothetical protein
VIPTLIGIEYGAITDNATDGIIETSITVLGAKERDPE